MKINGSFWRGSTKKKKKQKKVEVWGGKQWTYVIKNVVDYFESCHN